jgi:hypothetical protein
MTLPRLDYGSGQSVLDALVEATEQVRRRYKVLDNARVSRYVPLVQERNASGDETVSRETY